MKAQFRKVIPAMLALFTLNAAAITRYVDLNSPSPTPPYTNWPMAATHIQDAIDAASTGDFIVVSNGTYQTGGRVVAGAITNRVAVDKAVTVQSVNGPQVTRIVGERNASIPPEGIRCVYLATGAIVSGFTLTNGATRFSGDDVLERSGGGAWCADETGIITNCILAGNSAVRCGGGAFGGTLLNCLITNNVASFGGGVASNRLQNCVLASNSASYHNFNSGGGAYYSILDNCLITANRSLGGAGNGGGTFGGILTSCVLSNNTAGWYGGGAFLGVVSHSLISSNRASNSGGGAYSNTLINCVLRNNLTTATGGAAFNSILTSCTVVSNRAFDAG